MKVKIFPYEKDMFEVVIESESGEVVHDLVVKDVEIHDIDGLVRLETDGLAIFPVCEMEVLLRQH